MWPDSSINVANTVAEGQALSGKPVGAANHLLILLLQLFFQLVLGRPKITGPIVPTVAVMRYDNVAGCAQLLQRCLPARCAPHRITRPIYADSRWRRLGIGGVDGDTNSILFPNFCSFTTYLLDRRIASYWGTPTLKLDPEISARDSNQLGKFVLDFLCRSTFSLRWYEETTNYRQSVPVQVLAQPRRN